MEARVGNEANKKKSTMSSLGPRTFSGNPDTSNNILHKAIISSPCYYYLTKVFLLKSSTSYIIFPPFSPSDLLNTFLPSERTMAVGSQLFSLPLPLSILPQFLRTKFISFSNEQFCHHQHLKLWTVFNSFTLFIP